MRKCDLLRAIFPLLRVFFQSVFYGAQSLFKQEPCHLIQRSMKHQEKSGKISQSDSEKHYFPRKIIMREFIYFLVHLKWLLRHDPVLKNKIV